MSDQQQQQQQQQVDEEVNNNGEQGQTIPSSNMTQPQNQQMGGQQMFMPMYGPPAMGQFGPGGMPPPHFGMMYGYNMYPPQMPQGAFPPQQQQQHSSQAQQPHQGTNMNMAGSGGPNQIQPAGHIQQGISSGQSGENESGNPDPGPMSWAQRVRDHTDDEGENLAQQQQQQLMQQRQQQQEQLQEQQNNGVPRSNASAWSTAVKKRAKQFAEAQKCFLVAQNYSINPIMYILMMNPALDPSIQNMVMANQKLPEGYELLQMTLDYLKVIMMAPYLCWVNPEHPQFRPLKKYFVIQCVDEMEVFRTLRRVSWMPDSTKTEEVLTKAFEEHAGYGHVILFFIIPSLRKVVGVAELLSPVLSSDGERFVQLRWLFVRDIPYHSLKSYGMLDYTILRGMDQERQAERRTEAEGEGDGDGDGEGDEVDIHHRDEGFEEEQEQEEVPSAETAADAPEGVGHEGNGDVDEGKGKEEDGEDNDEEKEGAGDEQQQGFIGPKLYDVPIRKGTSAFDTVIRLKFNGGILLDFEEYMKAEEEQRAPNPRNLICGGPRHRPSVQRGRGMNRFGSSRGRGRGGMYNSGNGSNSGGAGGDVGNGAGSKRGRGRGRGRGSGRGFDDRGSGRYGSGRGHARDDRDGGRGRRSSQGDLRRGNARKVEGSEGVQTLHSKYAFEIQHKKTNKGSKKNLASATSSPETATEVVDKEESP